MRQHLAVLAVLPLLATALLGGEAVRVRAGEVAHVRTAQQQLEASRQLDALRRAVDQEVLPTLALAVARDPVASARAGFDTALDAVDQGRAAAWRSSGTAGFGAERAPVVAVAVTDRHAGDQRLLDDVTDAVVAADVPPASLTVIAGESAVGADPAASWHLGALRAMGVRVAVIGVGSTPVCDLPALPAHAVSLPEGLTTSDDPVRHRVVELLAVAARSVGADVVATGVATTGQLARARAAGAHAVRGPLVGRPMTAEQAAAVSVPLPLPAAAAPVTGAVPVSSPA